MQLASSRRAGRCSRRSNGTASTTPCSRPRCASETCSSATSPSSRSDVRPPRSTWRRSRPERSTRRSGSSPSPSRCSPGSRSRRRSAGLGGAHTDRAVVRRDLPLPDPAHVPVLGDVLPDRLPGDPELGRLRHAALHGVDLCRQLTSATSTRRARPSTSATCLLTSVGCARLPQLPAEAHRRTTLASGWRSWGKPGFPHVPFSSRAWGTSRFPRPSTLIGPRRAHERARGTPLALPTAAHRRAPHRRAERDGLPAHLDDPLLAPEPCSTSPSSCTRSAIIGGITFGDETLGYAAFVGPALLAASAMNGAFYDATNVFWKLRYGKVYNVMPATPISPGDVAVGETMWAVVRSLLYSFAFLNILLVLGLVDLVVLILPACFVIGFGFAGADRGGHLDAQLAGLRADQLDAAHVPLRYDLLPALRLSRGDRVDGAGAPAVPRIELIRALGERHRLVVSARERRLSAGDGVVGMFVVLVASTGCFSSSRRSPALAPLVASGRPRSRESASDDLLLYTGHRRSSSKPVRTTRASRSTS